MDRFKLVLCLIVVMGLSSACSPAPNSMVKVRPLEIHVVDAVTKEPVSSVVVYYRLFAARDQGDRGWPLPSSEFREIMTERSRLYTDLQGNISIPGKNVLLKPYEELYKEYVYINLDIVPSPLPENINDFFIAGPSLIINPISHLKGVLMTNNEGSYGDTHVLPERARYVLVDNWETFRKSKESVVVELERW